MGVIPSVHTRSARSTAKTGCMVQRFLGVHAREHKTQTAKHEAQNLPFQPFIVGVVDTTESA